jgi:hypothetical protein
MSEPEIARRCSHCGVSLRQRAMFCPQCGQKTGDTDVTETQLLDPEVRDTQILEPQIRDTQIIHPQLDDNPSSSRENPSPTASALTGVADNVRDRVGKIRHVSSVMLDQAGYDPSLRFLLVAAVLFVIFIVVLILSKVIG